MPNKSIVTSAQSLITPLDLYKDKLLTVNSSLSSMNNSLKNLSKYESERRIDEKHNYIPKEEIYIKRELLKNKKGKKSDWLDPYARRLSGIKVSNSIL